MLQTIFFGLAVYGFIDLLSCRCRCPEQPRRTEDHLDKMHRWAAERETKRLADLKRWKPPYVWVAEPGKNARRVYPDQPTITYRATKVEPRFS